MVQMHLGKRLIKTEDGQYVQDSGQTTAEGWSGRDLVADRVKCFTAGRNAMKRSMSACSSLPSNERLAAYASGRCDSAVGQRLSVTRMRTAMKIWGLHPLPAPEPVAAGPSARLAP